MRRTGSATVRPGNTDRHDHTCWLVHDLCALNRAAHLAAERNHGEFAAILRLATIHHENGPAVCGGGCDAVLWARHRLVEAGAHRRPVDVAADRSARDDVALVAAVTGRHLHPTPRGGRTCGTALDARAQPATA